MKTSTSDKTFLITGGCGFIGSHLVRRLAAEGAREIRVVDSMQYGDAGHLAGCPNTTLHEARLGWVDPSHLSRLLEGVDFVFHLAAEKHNQARARPHEVIRANIDGTMDLVQASGTQGVKKIIFASSLYAYGRLTGKAMVEEELLHPLTVYGISKVAGEHLLNALGRQTGVESVVLRFFFVYGPRQFAGQGYKSVIVKNFERILAGESPIVHGDGEQTLDYIYVDDVVDAMLASLRQGDDGEVFNIGSGRGTTVSALVEHMLAVADSSLGTTHGPADWTAGTYRVSDSSRAMRKLDWKPKTDLVHGLREVYRWMKQQVEDVEQDR